MLRKKILLISTFFGELGGAEKVALEEVLLLKENGFIVKTFALDSNEVTKKPDYSIKDDGFLDKDMIRDKSFLSKMHLFFKILFNIQVYIRLKKAISEFDPDIIHMHRVKVFSPSLYLVLKKFKKTKIMTLHDHYLSCPSSSRLLGNGQKCNLNKCKYLYALKNKCVRNSRFETCIALHEFILRRHLFSDLKTITQYIVPSKFMMKWTVDSGISAEMITYIPNFTSLKAVSPEHSKQDGIAFIGRLTEQKGISVLLEAAKLTPDINYNIIGKGPYEEKIVDIVKDNNLKNVRIKGALYGNDLIESLRQACALVLPSIWPENAPLTIIEAYSQGVPVIGSNLGGTMELIENEKTGFTFNSGDSNELAEKIKLIVYSADKDKMSRNCIEYYSRYFTRSTHFENMCKLYEKSSS